MTDPITELDGEYSSPDAMATPWTSAHDRLEAAGVYWVSTVRPDGRPHVTPVAGVWMDGSFYFSTGSHERKARNLAANARCAVTTGSNEFRDGLDVVVEGDAVRVADESTLNELARRLAAKYSDFFGFEARDGVFVHSNGGTADVFRVAPSKAFAYGRGDQFSATRYRF